MARIHFLIDPIHPEIGEKWPRKQVLVEEKTSDFEIHIVRGRLHAEALTRQILKKGSELIVCVGGDRVAHEVINVLYPQNSSQPKLYLFPRLHREELIRNMGSRDRFIDFLDDFLAGDLSEHRLDLVEARYRGDYGQELRRVFFGYAAFGFATSILHRLSSRGNSRLQLIRLISRGLAFYKANAIDIEVDGKELPRMNLLTGFVHNIPQVQGGLRLSPESDPSDGVVEISLIRKARLFRYYQMLIQFYATGLRATRWSTRASGRHLKIRPGSSGAQIRIDLDGETRGYLPLELNVKKQGLSLLK